jgi:Asp-tRNA(Asn)/Glu-tRNA(Gln) amidotransferase A subunit family amidase
MTVGLQYLSASEAIACIHAGEFRVVDWVQSCLDQIGRVDPAVKAWVYLDPENALCQAGTIDEKRKAGKVGVLSGTPVGVKDIFNTEDMPTQMGSPIWKDFTPGNDARVVHYLRLADAVFPGKTVTAEFAVHTPGPTLNPHNPEYMAGTSSTGSAVAVASYMVPLAIGTQTAGSTIRPASYVGIYGFKPSFGLLPRTGMLKTTDSLDTVGLFARTVEDLALLFEVMRVRGLDYPFVHAMLDDPSRWQRDDRPWKVGLIKGPKWDSAEQYAREALLRYAAEMGRLSGAVVEEAVLSETFTLAHRIHATIYDRTLAYYFKEEFKKHKLISGIMYETIERGNRISLDEYKAALEQQNALYRQLDQFFDGGYDVLLNLSTGGEAMEGLNSVDRPDNCLVWTLCGAPAINLPVFAGPNHLPFGAQVVARRYNDYVLLNFVKWLQEQGMAPTTTNPIPPLGKLLEGK